jgi:hypothetical protein
MSTTSKIYRGDEIQEGIQKAAQAISKAKYIVFTAGAGLGVDSKLPDFRGKGIVL